MASRRYLISLLSRSGIPQVRECVAAAASLTQHPKFPGLLLTRASALACSLGYSPGTLSVRDHILLGTRGFAFKLRGLVARLPYFSTNRFMSRTAVTGFPEGAAQFRTRCFMGGPAVQDFSGSSGQIFAGALQFILQAVLSLFGPC